MRKAMIIAIALVMTAIGMAYAQEDSGKTGTNPYTATKTVTQINPETGKLQKAVVISEGTSSTITRGIEAP